MPNQPDPQVARIDRQELAAMPVHWTRQQRGRYLRGLFLAKGIDPQRLYTITYYPHRTCWLLTQQPGEPGSQPPREAHAGKKADELFYAQVTTEFRRTALAANAAAGLHSAHFNCPGFKYQLPSKPQEVTPAALRALLGSPGEGDLPVRFDGEGGWQTGHSAN
jgi:hypothetical protein